MVEAYNILAALAALPLDTDQLLRINVIAVVRRIGAGIAAAYHRGDKPLVTIHAAQQHPAALVGIGLFAVPAKSSVLLFSDFQHVSGIHRVVGDFQFPIADVFDCRKEANQYRTPKLELGNRKLKATALLPRTSHSNTCLRSHTES